MIRKLGRQFRNIQKRLQLDGNLRPLTQRMRTPKEQQSLELQPRSDLSKNEIMGTRRQRSGQFFRKLELYREPDKHGSLIRQYKESDTRLWTNIATIVIGMAIVIPTLIMFWLDSKDRQTPRMAQVSQLVTQNASGDFAHEPTIGYLKNHKISLTRIDPTTDGNQSGIYRERINLPTAGVLRAGLPASILVNDNLSNADFRRANPAKVDLKSTNAILVDVDLSGAQLGDADLSQAFLKGANLSGAFLFNANLSGVNLTNANLSGANLFGSDLSGAILTSTNLSGAYLIIANLTGAQFVDADLSQTFLQGTSLSGANFSEANLSAAVLHGANLSQANLRGADLSAAKLSSARNLNQNQLDKACGDDKTQLPEGLTIKTCPEK